jgi:hypothetical protein
MIIRPLESQDQVLYSTLPALSEIPTLTSATAHTAQNSQTLQRFWSPLYLENNQKAEKAKIKFLSTTLSKLRQVSTSFS